MSSSRKENIILFDDDHWQSLLPITYTRPIAEIRIGILTIREKWEARVNCQTSFITQDYLSEKFPIEISNNNLVINSRLLPNDNMEDLILQLDINEVLLYQDSLIAARLDKTQFDKLIENQGLDELNGIDISKHQKYIHLISKPYDVFKENGKELAKDYKILTYGRTSEMIPYHCHPIAPDNIFIERGAKITCCTLNASDGPIYIGKDAEVMEGAHIRGPFALLDNSVVKMGAKIYKDTTVGPWSKVGGEVSNVVFQGYSNKGHDGYLGNSYIGEWCNLGADTNSSNLKNNYAEVKIWDYNKNGFSTTGLQFCGLITGDHSKTGINTMLNTGTLIGVNANVYGSGFPRTFIPSFSWGGSSGYKTYKIDKALEVAEKVMARRSIELSDQDKIILEYVYHNTATYRNWE